MPEEMKVQSESIAALAGALAKAQGEIKGAVKDSTNPHFKSSYADLASVWDACREQLTKNGLSVIQTFDNGINGVTVVTTLAHSSGEWIRGQLTLKPVKDDPQGVGSAITYARRYALAAMVGVAPDDDDGNAASGRPANNSKAPTSAPAKPPANHGEAQGPLPITKLKDAVRLFSDDLARCSDEDELNGLMTSSKGILDQCERDLPGWYYTKDGSDVTGVVDRIKTKRQQLSQQAA